MEAAVRLGVLAERIGCRLDGDGAIEVRGVRALDEAGPTDLSFLTDAKRVGLVSASRAGAVILPDAAAAVVPDWNLWVAILVLGIVAGGWTIYGGLSSVAWTDFFALIIMIGGGFLVTILGLYALSPDGSSLTSTQIDGWLSRNTAMQVGTRLMLNVWVAPI